MNVPDAYELALLGLAAFRTYRLLGIDTILDRPREWLVKANTRAYKESLDDFIACPWCLGFWNALGWWLLWLLFPTFTVFVAVPWALSAIVGLVRVRLDE